MTTEMIDIGPTLNEQVAAKVFGLRWHIVRARGSTEEVMVWGDHPALTDGQWSAADLRRYGGVPNYEEDPAADYEVLRHVREAWVVFKKARFLGQLRAILATRGDYSAQIYYEPGDYARAALAAVTATGGGEAAPGATAGKGGERC